LRCRPGSLRPYGLPLKTPERPMPAADPVSSILHTRSPRRRRLGSCPVKALEKLLIDTDGRLGIYWAALYGSGLNGRGAASLALEMTPACALDANEPHRHIAGRTARVAIRRGRLVLHGRAMCLPTAEPYMNKAGSRLPRASLCKRQPKGTEFVAGPFSA